MVDRDDRWAETSELSPLLSESTVDFRSSPIPWIVERATSSVYFAVPLEPGALVEPG